MQNPLSKFVPQLVGEYPRKFQSLFESVSIIKGFEKEEIRDLLWKAYEFSSIHHEGQKRKSGEPYFNHCIEVASILADWGMDKNMIISGMLHDTLEDYTVTLRDRDTMEQIRISIDKVNTEIFTKINKQ